MVFPDGTTALLDAGDAKNVGEELIKKTIANPPIVTIVDYVRQVLPKGNDSID